MPDPTGRGGGYARGCRCDECREAHRARMARAISRRSATRTEIGGRLVAVNAPEHGTRSTYDNWNCRCTACTASNTRASADRRKRLTHETPADVAYREGRQCSTALYSISGGYPDRCAHPEDHEGECTP